MGGWGEATDHEEEDEAHDEDGCAHRGPRARGSSRTVTAGSRGGVTAGSRGVTAELEPRSVAAAREERRRSASQGGPSGRTGTPIPPSHIQSDRPRHPGSRPSDARRAPGPAATAPWRRAGAASRQIRADSESSSGVAPRAGSSRTSRAGARGAPKPRRPPARGRAQHPEARNNETRVEEARGRRGPQRTEAHGDRLRGAGEERPDEEGQAHLREGGAARRRAMRDPVTEGAVRRRPRRQGTLGRRRARRAPLKKSRTFSRGQV